MHIEGRIGPDFIPQGATEILDEEVFNSIIEASENKLPETALVEGDYDDDGKPYPKIVRLAYNGSHDKAIWDLLNSESFTNIRQDFLRYLREEKVTSITSSINMPDNYARGANVSLANIFLGFRKVAANFVWLKVDTFYHQGMTHRMMPLMRTCVTLDPNFIEAFLLGAWHISYNETAGMYPTPPQLMEWNDRYQVFLGERELYYYRGIDFLKEGIDKNPRDYRLYFDLGYAIYEKKLEDHANAARYLEAALHHRHDKWVPRMLYGSLMRNGEYEKAIAGWTDYLGKNMGTPSEYTAHKFIKINTALLNEKQAKEAEAAGDTSQADKHNSEARKIWEELLRNDVDPTLALARIHIMDSKKYVAEKRYYEAIALLDRARWEHVGLFGEISDLMIEIKQEGNIPLSHSEQMQVIRVREAEKYRKLKGMPAA